MHSETTNVISLDPVAIEQVPPQTKRSPQIYFQNLPQESSNVRPWLGVWAVIWVNLLAEWRLQAHNLFSTGSFTMIHSGLNPLTPSRDAVPVARRFCCSKFSCTVLSITSSCSPGSLMMALFKWHFIYPDPRQAKHISENPETNHCVNTIE